MHFVLGLLGGSVVLFTVGDKPEKIEREKGLDWLPDKIKEVAILRRDNPDLSIAALGELCDPPLKKSGINGRLKKLVELADKI